MTNKIQRARLDEAVRSVSDSLKANFNTKVSSLRLKQSYGVAPLDVDLIFLIEKWDGQDDLYERTLQRFFDDLARNAVSGISDLLITEDETK